MGTVGRHSMNPSELITDLTEWTRRWFEGAERTHVWSAQDYQAHGGVPFVGKLPRVVVTYMWPPDTTSGA